MVKALTFCPQFPPSRHFQFQKQGLEIGYRNDDVRNGYQVEYENDKSIHFLTHSMKIWEQLLLDEMFILCNNSLCYLQDSDCMPTLRSQNEKDRDPLMSAIRATQSACGPRGGKMPASRIILRNGNSYSSNPGLCRRSNPNRIELPAQTAFQAAAVAHWFKWAKASILPNVIRALRFN